MAAGAGNLNPKPLSLQDRVETLEKEAAGLDAAHKETREKITSLSNLLHQIEMRMAEVRGAHTTLKDMLTEQQEAAKAQGGPKPAGDGQKP